MNNNYNVMREDEIVPELDERRKLLNPKENAYLMKLKVIGGLPMRKFPEMWTSIKISLSPILLVFQLFENHKYPSYWSILHYLPIFGYLLFFLIKYSELSHTAYYWVILSTEVCIFIFVFGMRFQANVRDNIFNFICTIASVVTAIAIFLLNIVVIVLASIYMTGTIKTQFLVIFSILSIITNQGLVLVAIIAFLPFTIIELFIRLITCKLKPCCWMPFILRSYEANYYFPKVESPENEKLNVSCAYCNKSFDENDTVVKIGCKGYHLFHTDCAALMTKAGSGCPICNFFSREVEFYFE